MRRITSRYDRAKKLLACHSLVSLSNPDLRDILGIDRWQRRVQGSWIERSIHSRWEKDQGHALDRLDMQLQCRKRRFTASLHIVQVDQDRDRALTSVGGETASILLVQVERIKVLIVLLRRKVATDCGE